MYNQSQAQIHASLKILFATVGKTNDNINNTIFIFFLRELELFLAYSYIDQVEVESSLLVMALMESSQWNWNQCFSVAVFILGWNISPQLKW